MRSVLFPGPLRGGRENRCGIDSQTWARCQRWQSGVGAIELKVRGFVITRRASRTPDVPDPDAIAFIANLKVGHMKYRQRDIVQISQPGIVEGHHRIRRRRLATMQSK